MFYARNKMMFCLYPVRVCDEQRYKYLLPKAKIVSNFKATFAIYVD